MTDTQLDKFNSWKLKNSKEFIDGRTEFDVWQASAKVAQGRIDTLEYANLNVKGANRDLCTLLAEREDKITALEARNSELESAITNAMNCIREEINLNNYNEQLLGDFLSDYGDAMTILQQAILSTQPTEALDRFENEVIERCAVIFKDYKFTPSNYLERIRALTESLDEHDNQDKTET